MLITLHHPSFPKAITAVHTPQQISLRHVATLPSYQQIGLPRGLTPFRFHGKKKNNSAYIFYFLRKFHVSCQSHRSFPFRATRISWATTCRVLGAHRAISNGKTPCNAFLRTANTDDRTTFGQLQAVYLKRHILHRQFIL